MPDDVDVDAACRANRELRDRLPAPLGARLVAVTDNYTASVESPGEGSERTVIAGVETTWLYEWEGASKCQVAATLEDPVVAQGWHIRALETAALHGDGTSIRHAELFGPPAAAQVSWNPPAQVTLTVEAESARRPQLQEDGTPFPSPFTPCQPDQPPPPPFPTDAPPPGDGKGPSGSCDGTETKPPCGPGVELGRHYAYTVIQDCTGTIWLDGRQWDAGLIPQQTQPPQNVWIRMESPTSARWQGAEGAISYVPKGAPGHRDTPKC